jgi:hypothetical protein
MFDFKSNKWTPAHRTLLAAAEAEAEVVSLLTDLNNEVSHCNDWYLKPNG